MTVSSFIFKKENNLQNMQKIAVFDVGTNNIQILLAEYVEGELLTKSRYSEVSALGKDMKNRLIAEDAFERFFNIIDKYVPICKAFTDNIKIVGTSCSRDALNIDRIINYLRDKYQLDYTIIDSDQEATFNGLANAYEFDFDKFLIFDIGGGSTEFTLIEDRKVKKFISVDLGIRRLNNKFGDDEQAIKIEIKRLLDLVPDEFHNVRSLVGVGGTVTSISAVKQGIRVYSSEKVHKSQLSKEDISRYIEAFKKMSFAEISEKMPFEPQRAEIIGIGLQIIYQIMTKLSADTINASDHGLMYGAAVDFFNSKEVNEKDE